MSTIKKVTKYSKLVSAKAKVCAGKGTRAALKKAASAYVKDAVEKAVKAAPKTAKKTVVTKKAKAEATRKANKVLKAACSVGIAGKKAQTKRVGKIVSKPGKNTRECDKGGGRGKFSTAKKGACAKHGGLRSTGVKRRVTALRKKKAGK